VKIISRIKYFDTDEGALAINQIIVQLGHPGAG